VRRLHNQAVTGAEAADGTQTPRVSLDASFVLAGAAAGRAALAAAAPSLALLAPLTDAALDHAFDCAGDATRLPPLPATQLLQRRPPSSSLPSGSSPSGGSGGSGHLDRFQAPTAVGEEGFVACLQLLLRAGAPAHATIASSHGSGSSSSSSSSSSRDRALGHGRDRSHQQDSGDFDDLDNDWGVAEATGRIGHQGAFAGTKPLPTLAEGVGRESSDTVASFALPPDFSSSGGRAARQSNASAGTATSGGRGVAVMKAPFHGALKRTQGPYGERSHAAKNASFASAASGESGAVGPDGLPLRERAHSVAFAPDTVDHVSGGDRGGGGGGHPHSSSSNESDRFVLGRLTDPRDGRGLSLDRAERRARRRARAEAAASEGGAAVLPSADSSCSSSVGPTADRSRATAHGSRPPPPGLEAPGERRRRRRRALTPDGLSSGGHGGHGSHGGHGGHGSHGSHGGHGSGDEESRRARHERRRKAKEAGQLSANGRRRKSKASRAKVPPGMRQSLARKSSDLSPIGERTEDEAETDWEDGVPVDKGSRSRSRWASLSSEGATTASSGAESADLGEEEEEEEEGVDGLGSDATARAQRAAEAEGGGSSDGGGSGAGLDRRPNARSSGDGFGDDEATDGEERRGEQATRGGSRERTRTVDFDDFDDDFDDDGDDDDDDDDEAAARDAADGLGWDGDASQVSDCDDTFSEASSVYDDDNNADDDAPTEPDDRTSHLEPPLHLGNPSSARTSASARTSSEKALSSLPSRASAASDEGAEEAPGDLAAGKPGGTLAESTAASGQASPRRESGSHGKPAPFEERQARGFATPRAAASAPGKAGAESRQLKTPLAPLKSATPAPDAAGLRDSVETLSPRRDLNRPLARAMSS
jgi:hypothetical protein